MSFQARAGPSSGASSNLQLSNLIVAGTHHLLAKKCAFRACKSDMENMAGVWASTAYGPRYQKPSLCCLRTIKTQTSLRTSAVWSSPLILASLNDPVDIITDVDYDLKLQIYRAQWPSGRVFYSRSKVRVAGSSLIGGTALCP